jgi:putative protease
MAILAVTCENLKSAEEFHACGADEVIFALKNACFSPLASFSCEEIRESIQTVHAMGMRVSVLMNALFHEGAVDQASRMMKELVQAGADGIIFADTGLMMEAVKNGFADRMIYQPETMMTSSYDASVWQHCGIQALMISTLLTEEEILKIASSAKNTGMNIHGWQLMSVSARPLLSAYGAVSGLGPLKNRKGLTLVEAKREGRMPVYENEQVTMIFSDYVLESFEEIRRFQKAGMKRFTVDSWNLSEESVQDALKIYRSLLDEKEPSVKIEEYREKYNELPLEKGYYENKTVR